MGDGTSRTTKNFTHIYPSGTANRMHLPLFAVVFFFAILGRSVWVAAAENGNTNVLDEDLFNRALAHAAGFMPANHGLVERLRNGEVEALFDVAKVCYDTTHLMITTTFPH